MRLLLSGISERVLERWVVPYRRRGQRRCRPGGNVRCFDRIGWQEQTFVRKTSVITGRYKRVIYWPI